MNKTTALHVHHLFLVHFFDVHNTGWVLLVILRGGVPPGSSNPDLTKIGKVYTRFQTKTAQKPYPMGRHTPI